MKIGMIGAGDVGQVLTQLFVRAGNTVVLAHRGSVDALDDLARVLGAATGTVEQAEAQDLVVLAVPFFAIKALPLPNGNEPITFQIGMNGFPRLNVIKKQRHKWSRSIFIHTASSKPLIQLKWRYLHSSHVPINQWIALHCLMPVTILRLRSKWRR